MNGHGGQPADFEDENEETDVLIFHIMITDPLYKLK